MKVTVIPIIIGALGTVPKGLVKELEELEIGLVGWLVYLFYGISTVEGYLMPKLFSEKNSSGTI